MRPPPASHRSELRRYAAAAVAAAAVLVYLNALANGYVLDDRAIIAGNPLVHSLDGLWRAFAHPYWPEVYRSGTYRPLGVASFALDWAVSGGSPAWLHAVNILWHAGAALLVWRLADELLAPAAALAAGLAFAVHPVHVEAVANTVGRLECMAAAFAVAALLAHRRASLAAPVLFALGLLSKENAVVLLGLVLAHDLLLDGPPAESLRRRRALYASYAVVLLGYVAALSAVFRETPYLASASVFRGVGTTERLLTAASVVPHHLRLLLAPVKLSADYNPGVLDLVSGVTPMVVAGAALGIALLAAIAVAWRREPRLAFALAWVPIAVAPVSNVFFPSGVLLAERTLYLPSVGAVLVMGWLVERAGSWRPRPTLAAAAAVLALFALRTWTRTPVWRDNRTYTLTLLADHPESYSGHRVAGRVLAATGDWEGAAREYASALAIFRRDPGVYREAAEVAVELRRLDEAEALLDSAIALDSTRIGPLLRRAELRFHRGDLSGATSAAERALALAPDSARAVAILAELARRRGDTVRAAALYRRIGSSRPGAPGERAFD